MLGRNENLERALELTTPQKEVAPSSKDVLASRRLQSLRKAAIDGSTRKLPPSSSLAKGAASMTEAQQKALEGSGLWEEFLSREEFEAEKTVGNVDEEE